MTTMGILTVITLVIIYFLMAVMIRGSIKDSIEITSNRRVVSTSLLAFVTCNNKIIIRYGAVLFPLYLCFTVGFFIGEKMYEILIDNDEENRIASWVF